LLSKILFSNQMAEPSRS